MKKKISFILAAVMLVANFAISAMAAEKNTMFTDVTDKTQYSEAILTLAKLGVINGYDENGTKLFKPEGGITRAEFAAIITRAMGIADTVGGASPFTDVPETHWAVKNIIASTDRGITNGMGDGTFHPDDNVTYEQAIKMVVCAMNYTISAEASGGWPDGYFTQGTIMGLTNNIGAGVLRTSPAPRGVVAQIMYNALDIKVADSETGKATKDTFLNKFMNMEMVKGKVVGIEDDLTADCDETLASDEMAILPKNGDMVYVDFEDYADKEAILSYLGQEVLIFYEIASTGGVNKLVILDSEITKNETDIINSEDIVSYSNGKLEYYNESGKKKTIDFEEDKVTIFYNKKAVTSGISSKLDAWLKPANADTFIYGSVTFTDSGADGKIDMVEIMDYDYLVALRAPSSSDYTVTNKMKFKDKSVVERVIDSVTLNPDKNSYSFVIEDQNGKKLETTSIKANNVVSVAVSEARDYFTVKVSTEVVDGSVSAFSEEDNTIKIGDKEYTITNDCIEYLNEQETKLESGSKGKFYLDAFGNVAYATLNVSTESTTIMYLITAYYDEDTDKGQLRGFVPGSGYKEYTLDKKVKLDGSNKSTAEAIEQLRENSENFVSVKYKNEDSYSNGNQLLKLELEGTTVKEIASANISDTGVAKDTSGVKLYHYGPKSYKYSSGTFTTEDKTDKFFVNSSTIFISVPEDRTAKTSYYKRTTSYFSVDGVYSLEAVNVNDKNYAEIVLIYPTDKDNKPTGTTPVSVLMKKIDSKYVNDEQLNEISIYTTPSNKATSVIVDEEQNVSNIAAGDIFRYVLNGEERATGIELAITYKEIKAQFKANSNGITYDWTELGKGYGQRPSNKNKAYSTVDIYNLVSVDEDGMSMVVTKNGFKDGELVADYETELIQLNTSTKILKMNADGDELLTVDEDSEVELTVDDLQSAEFEDDKCSKIAVITFNSDYARLIIIYE